MARMQTRPGPYHAASPKRVPWRGFVKGGVGVTDKVGNAYEKMVKLGGTTRRRNV